MAEKDVPDVASRRGPAPTKHIDILWAATRLFARKGIAQTTTREIAAEAQTTERTLFKHFGSKELLLRAVISGAVVDSLAPASLAGLAQAIRTESSDLETWHRNLLHARANAIAQAPELTRLLLTELLRDEQVREQFAQEWLVAAWQPLEDRFDTLKSEGRIRSDIESSTLCRMFLSLNIGYLVSRYVLAPDIRWDEDSEIRAIASTFARGIKTD